MTMNVLGITTRMVIWSMVLLLALEPLLELGQAALAKGVIRGPVGLVEGAPRCRDRLLDFLCAARGTPKPA